MFYEDYVEWYHALSKPRSDALCARVMLDEENERLVLGIFFHRERVGIYVMTHTGYHQSYSEQDKLWCGVNFSGLVNIGKQHSGCYSCPEVKIHILSEYQLFEDYFHNVLNERTTFGVSRSFWYAEYHYGEKRRELAASRKRQRIDNRMSALPPRPKDFKDWCMEVALEDVNFAFGKRGCDQYTCTACGKRHTAKNWKDRQLVTCSRTGKTVKVDKRNQLRQIEGYAMLCQVMPDGKDTVARHIKINADFSFCAKGGTVKVGIYDQFVMFLPRNATSAHEWYYNIYSLWSGNTFWDNKNLGGWKNNEEYVYPNGLKQALAGTLYGCLGIDVLAERRKAYKYNDYMKANCGWGVMEYLIKGGYDGIVRDVFYRGNYRLHTGADVSGVLGINMQRAHRLRASGGGYDYLVWLQYEEMENIKISEDAMRWLSGERIYPAKAENNGRYDVSYVGFILDRMSPDQVANYLRRQQKKTGLSVHNLVIKWDDTLSMAGQLELDTSQEMLYRPKHLKERHDELCDIIAGPGDGELADKMRKAYPGAENVMRRIKQIYEWSNDEYTVIVPQTIEEIVREGRLQNDCVGKAERYYERIESRESFTMFLRRAETPRTPWYTMEVEPGGKVRQLRTYGDDDGKNTDRKQAKAAIATWRRAIAPRMGKQDAEDAIVSREKRLQEFAELRKSQTQVWHGKYQGQLLYKILEHDFEELNENEEVAV